MSQSEIVRNELTQLGWKDGDPIPPDLGAYLGQLRLDAIADIESAIADGSPDIPELRRQLNLIQKMKLVKVSELPLKQQMEAREYVMNSIEDIQTQQAVTEQAMDIEARIPQQIQGEEREKIRQRLQGNGPEVLFEDDMPSEQSLVEPKEHPTYCPCCNWNLTKPFELEATEEDKQAFLLSLLGQARFAKVFRFLGDRFLVEFRTLEYAEVQTITRELSELQSKGMVTELTYLAAFQDLRFMLSIAEVRLSASQVIAIPPILEWIKANPPTAADKKDKKNNIMRFIDYFNSQFPQIPVRTALRKTHDKFYLLCEHLIERIDDANFY
jgi:hypothetical protein